VLGIPGRRSDVLEMLADEPPAAVRACARRHAGLDGARFWGTGAGLLLGDSGASVPPAARLGPARRRAELGAVDRARADLPGAADAREHAGAVSSIHVFFIVFVSVARACSVHAGPSRSFACWRRPAALAALELRPACLAGSRVGAAAALAGRADRAIIGEWFGAPRGIGILIINAMQNFQIVLCGVPSCWQSAPRCSSMAC
jgi:NitT/TauT family transport system permease protein